MLFIKLIFPYGTEKILEKDHANPVLYSFLGLPKDENGREGGKAMGYILCLIGGACLGVITMSLMVAAGDEDEKREM